MHPPLRQGFTGKGSTGKGFTGTRMLLVVCVCATSACGPSYQEDFREIVEKEEIVAVEQVTGLAIQGHAEAIGIWKILKPNEVISIKLQAREDDIDQIFKETPLSVSDLKSIVEAENETSEQSSFPPNRLWWDPGMHGSLKVASCELDNGDLLHVGLKPKNKPAEQPVIYITLDRIQSGN